MGFRTGERVELLVDLDHDVPKGTKGYVRQVLATNSYLVEFDGRDGTTRVYGDDLKEVVSEAIQRGEREERKFRTGDRVELLVDLDHDVAKGTKGTVTEPVATNSYRVKFDGRDGTTIVYGDDLQEVVSEAIPRARERGVRGGGTKGRKTKVRETKGKGIKKGKKKGRP